MGPKAHYQQLLQQGGIYADPAQQQAVDLLDGLRSRLIAFTPAASPKGFVSNLLGKWSRPADPEPVTGLYFWGGVGRGKTFLMDLFYDSLPFEQSAECISIGLCCQCMPSCASCKAR